MDMTRFTDLDAWNVGLDLVKEIYVLTKKFPKEELFGLTSQLRRSSKSILANMAEGCGRFTFADKAAKFVIARGECMETEAHIRIAIRLGFITQDESKRSLELIQHTGRLISGLISSVKNRSHKKTNSPIH